MPPPADLLVLLVVVYSVHLVHLQPADYHCEYLATHKDLVCQCKRYTMEVSSLSSLLSQYPGRVESIKLHLCQSLDITISTIDIPQPFYQLRIEDIDIVTLHGVELGQGHSLDILVRNVRDTLSMLGRVACSDCPTLSSNISNDVRLNAKPTMVIQVKDTRQATINYMDITNVNFRLKTRNVENVNIINSQVDKITKNGFEVFYSQGLDISNSIFKHVDDEAVTLNHVDKVTVTHTLGFNSKMLHLLSNETELSFSCTAPYEGILGPLYTWGEECGPVSVLPYHKEEGGSGAMILTLCCVGVLLIIILGLLLMHKKGKLEWLL